MRRVLIALNLLLACVASAQFGPAPKATLKLEKTTAAVGSVIKGVITVEIAEGYHTYSNPPSTTDQIPLVVSLTGLKLVKIDYPKGVDYTPNGETKPIKVYKETIKIPVTLKVTGKPGKVIVVAKVDYQQCNDSSCFPPDKVEAKATLTVTKAKGAKG